MTNGRAEDPDIRFDDLLGAQIDVPVLDQGSLGLFIDNAVNLSSSADSSVFDDLFPADLAEADHDILDSDEGDGDGLDDLDKTQDSPFDSLYELHDSDEPDYDDSDQPDVDDGLGEAPDV